MEDLQTQLDEANETIEELQSDLDNANEEIDTLQDEVDSLEGQLEDERKEGYAEGLADAKLAIENLE